MSEPRQLVVLGIESSCDETAAGIVLWQKDGVGQVLSDVVRSQHERHAAFGGVVPEVAARAHVEILEPLIREALRQAQMSLGQLDAVAATAGPGLVGGLMVGLSTAKTIALTRKIPFVAVNHLEGHALVVGLTQNINVPYLLLLVSGGHTQLLSVLGLGQYRLWGSTRDDAVGESFDKAARLLGLGFPGGPALEKVAQNTGKKIRLPRPLLGTAGCDMSFSGLKTALRKEVERREPLTECDVKTLAWEFQKAVTDCLADKVVRGMALHKEVCPDPLCFVASGGVAANKYLRHRLTAVARAEGFFISLPPPHLCTDNGVMIAWAGAQRLGRGERSFLSCSARPRWPLEDLQPPCGAAL